MKIFFYACYACSVIIAIGACNLAEQEAKTVKMNAKDINLGPIVHDSLSADQMEKVRRIHKTFEEVYPASLEETVTNFKRDQNPDKEIAIWLNMASTYEKFIGKYPGTDSLRKQEAFKLILLRSMMSDQEATKEAGLKALNNEEINELLRNYNAEAVSVTTREQ